MKRVSIVVPVYNGGEFLEPFFRIFYQDLNFNDIEVLIVDNGSPEPFYGALQEEAEKFDFISVYSYEEKKSSYAARNFGFKQSVGEIIAFTDFDCVLTPQYIQELTKFPSDEKNLVSGKIELFHVKNNIYEIFDRNAYLKQEEYFDNKYAATANLILCRETFSKLTGFKALTSGGDNEFCKRAIANGFDIKYNLELLVKHPMRGTYTEHIKKAKRLGKGHGQLFKIEKIGGLRKILFLIKTLFGVFIPVHQLSIFFRIMKNEKIKIVEFFPLLRLCYNVGMLQRIQILKKAL